MSSVAKCEKEDYYVQLFSLSSHTNSLSLSHANYLSNGSAWTGSTVKGLSSWEYHTLFCSDHSDQVRNSFDRLWRENNSAFVIDEKRGQNAKPYGGLSEKNYLSLRLNGCQSERNKDLLCGLPILLL